MKLRDFDFRIWCEENKAYIAKDCFIFKRQNSISTGTDIHYKELGLDYYGNLQILKPDEFHIEIELWIGFYDKNGKKIFENDILKNETLGEIYHVKINEEYKTHEVVRYKRNCKENNIVGIDFFGVYPSEKYLKIIGNIHETRK